jgi:hypothetical protein
MNREAGRVRLPQPRGDQGHETRPEQQLHSVVPRKVTGGCPARRDDPAPVVRRWLASAASEVKSLGVV